MSKKNFLFALIFALFSCSAETSTNNAPPADTLAAKNVEEKAAVASPSESVPVLKKVHAGFTDAVFPFKIESPKEMDYSKNPDPMSFDFFLKFFKPKKNSDLERFKNDAELLLPYETQDDIFSSGKFDAGSNVIVHFYPGKIFRETADLLIFTLIVYTESYPACPAGSGSYCYLVKAKPDGTMIDEKLIAELSGGADPPVAGERYVSCQSASFEEGFDLSIKNVNIEMLEDGKEQKDVENTRKKVFVQADGAFKE